MKEKRLLKALGQVDKMYVEEAFPVQKTKRHGWLKWGTLAACLCLVITGGFLYKAEYPYPVKEETAPNPPSEIVEIPHWDDMKIYEQYNEIMFNGLCYNARNGEIGKERLGAELTSVVASGFDVYADEAGKDADRYTEAAIYEIAGISSECAVAVRYEGTNVYYAAVNSAYRPGTLKQFVEDLDLRNTLVFGDAYYEKKKLFGEYATIRFENLDSTKIWEMLLSGALAVNKYDDLNFSQPAKILSISVDIPLLGYENISISIHEDGYIITNILDTGKMFCIGEENTQAIIDYVLDECDGYEIVYAADKGNTPE